MNAEKKAQNILNGRSQYKYYLREWMEEEEIEVLWNDSYHKFVDMINEYSDISSMVAIHVYNSVFPNAAIYLSLKEMKPDKAYEILQNMMARDSKKMGENLKKCTKIPGFKKFFLWMWNPGSHYLWGEKAGFKTFFYPRKTNMFKMDIYECPYHKYTTLLKCPEIGKFFCDNDIYTYGNLPGMSFSRMQTLATGGKLCDFEMKIVYK